MAINKFPYQQLKPFLLTIVTIHHTDCHSTYIGTYVYLYSMHMPFMRNKKWSQRSYQKQICIFVHIYIFMNVVHKTLVIILGKLFNKMYNIQGWCDVHHDPNAAESCNLQTCVLPDCFCSKDGTLIPGNLEVNQV